MSNSLRLHPKYGVNPTVVICYWCGKERGDLALLGAAYKGEAPRNMCLDYEPCEECRTKMSLGVVIIEVADSPRSEKQIALQEGAYPTGRWVVMTREAAERKWGEAAAGGKAVMSVADFTSMLPAPEDNDAAKD
jgi:hypothetical protein